MYSAPIIDLSIPLFYKSLELSFAERQGFCADREDVRHSGYSGENLARSWASWGKDDSKIGVDNEKWAGLAEVTPANPSGEADDSVMRRVRYVDRIIA